jgi:hypothetical protein
MTDQPLDDAVDTEGHSVRWHADAERNEGDDTEGHNSRWHADAERNEGDDTEGDAPGRF